MVRLLASGLPTPFSGEARGHNSLLQAAAFVVLTSTGRWLLGAPSWSCSALVRQMFPLLLRLRVELLLPSSPLCTAAPLRVRLSRGLRSRGWRC